MRNDITKKILVEYYIDRELNPYEIAAILDCNHKTIRSYLRKFEIPLRSASEYNYLAHKSHSQPSWDDLMKPKSIAAHIAYLCEGWHTERSNCMFFCNQDPQLVHLVQDVLIDLYLVKSVRLTIATPTTQRAKSLHHVFPEAKIYIDESRKNPIVRLCCGGKMLVRDFVQNAYLILKKASD